MLRTLKKLLPGERAIQDSMTSAARGFRQVSIEFNPAKASTFVRGVATSGSYSDPVCVHRLAAQDRRELSALIAQAKKRGCGVLLVTTTMSHGKGMPLHEEREALQKTWENTFSGRWWQNLQAEWLLKHEGSVKVWESPFGRNGWHCHPHALMIMSRELSKEQLHGFESEIKREYIRQLRKLGYKADWEHGIDVRAGDSAIADYIAKFGKEPQYATWGADAEIAGVAVKSGHSDSVTYFELLGAAAGYKADLERLAVLFPKLDDTSLKARVGVLVKEYFYAFKGNRRVQWSPGLNKKFEVAQTLAELEAAEPDEDNQTFSMATIETTPKGWSKLWRENKTAELVNLCRRGDAFAVAVWLRDHDIDGCVPRVAFEFTLAQEDERQVRDSFNASHIGGHYEKIGYPSPGVGSPGQPSPVEAVGLWNPEPPHIRDAPATHL